MNQTFFRKILTLHITICTRATPHLCYQNLCYRKFDNSDIELIAASNLQHATRSVGPFQRTFIHSGLLNNNFRFITYDSDLPVLLSRLLT